jgi:hypothetical protein
MKIRRLFYGPLGLATAVVVAIALHAAGGPAGALTLLGLPDAGHPTHVVDPNSPVVPWNGTETASASIELQFAGCGSPFDHADVRETPTTVTITVHVRKPEPLPALPPSSAHYGMF